MPKNKDFREKQYKTPERYLFRDEYEESINSPAINDTYTISGARRIVTDTADRTNITNGYILFNGVGVANLNPRITYDVLIPRVNGRIFIAKFSTTGAGNVTNFYTPSTIDGTNGSFLFKSTTTPDFDFPTNIGIVYGAVILRPTGFYTLYRDFTFWKNWILISTNPTSTVNDNPIYPAVSAESSGYGKLNFFRCPDYTFLVPILAYDTFSRVDGAVGVTELVGPDGQQIQSLTWGSSVGTWGIVSNQLKCSALSGGIGIQTIDFGNKDYCLTINLVSRSGGNMGLVCRYVDSNNYLYVYYDGSRVRIGKVVGGVTTASITSLTRTFVADKPLQIYLRNNRIGVTYNGSAFTSFLMYTITDSVLLNSTVGGVYTTNVGNVFDNFVCYPMGNSGEYNILDRWIKDIGE